MSHVQLHMRASLAEPIPSDRPLASGYLLRVATPDDAEGLGAVLTESFGDPWPADKVLADLLGDPNVPRTFLVEANGQVVATASSQRIPERFPNAGVVHMVGAAAGHAGKGLGYAVTRAALAYFAPLPVGRVWLTTDDHRLPAIATYLRLGFRPVHLADDHEERWNAVMQRLAGGRPNG